MKEKNLKRKRELKKRREKILVKKALHKDISNFMVRICARTCYDPFNEFTRMLDEGFKGYSRMRSRELIKDFEYAYNRLHNLEFRQQLEKSFADSHGTRTHSFEGLFSERNPTVAVNLFILESDALMNRLVEQSFDLDFDE